MIYSNAKSFKDLQIKTLVGSKTSYDVYVNYSKLFKSLVPVGSQTQKFVQISDVDIIYTDDQYTQFSSFAVFLGDQGVCYLSKYDTSFESE